MMPLSIRPRAILFLVYYDMHLFFESCKSHLGAKMLLLKEYEMTEVSPAIKKAKGKVFFLLINVISATFESIKSKNHCEEYSLIILFHTVFCILLFLFPGIAKFLYSLH